MSKKSVVIRSFKDTRGLSPDLDPRYFYVYASQARHKQAVGLEGLLHHIFPSTLWESLAFAIDPWSQFKVSLGKISPMTRTRRRKVNSVLNNRTITRAIDNYDTYRGIMGPETPGTYKSYESPHAKTTTTYTLSPQESLEWVSSDTTSRFRVIGSTQGEFSSWKVQTESPGYRLAKREVGRHFYSNVQGGYMYTMYRNESNAYATPAARIPASTVSNLFSTESAAATTIMQKQALSMFKGILPTHRTYTLFRNLVELKDLPRGVAQLRKSIQDLRQLDAAMKVPTDVMKRIASFGTTLSDIPKEWLSYAFGWRQTYSDVVGLLAAPQKIGRKIDLLIKRDTKPTTYRSKRNLSSEGVASSGFLYDTAWLETVISGPEHHVSRDTELRMVVNTTFSFPPIDIPRLRSTEFYRQLGVTPTFTDFYNLVPWSWLVDWFTGLGDYVEIIDNINSSPDLINWGLLTADVQGKLVTRRITKFDKVDSYSKDSDPVQYTTTSIQNRHHSTLLFNLHLRKDLSTLYNVNIATDPTKLTLYQQSILGALITTRTRFRR